MFFPRVINRKEAVQAVQHIVLLDIPTFRAYRLIKNKRYTSGTSGTTSGTDITTCAAGEGPPHPPCPLHENMQGR